MNYNLIGENGAVYGPVDFDGLRKWASESRLTPQSVLEEVGTGRRFPASSLPGLFPAATPFSNVIQEGYGQPTQTGYATPPGGPMSAAQYPRGVTGPPIQNNLAKAIFSTVCCCFPIGIVAIINAAQVNSKQAAGDYSGAVEAAKNADKYANISIGIVLAIGILRFLAAFVLHLGRLR